MPRKKFKEPKVDAETQKLLDDGEALTDLVSSRGWGIIKENLLQRINHLKSIETLPAEDVGQILTALEGRKTAIAEMSEWLSDVEATVHQHAINKKMVIPDEDHITRL